MKKLLILIFTVFTVVSSFAQDKKGLNTSLNLASQHWGRGIAYTVAPTFEGDISYKFCNWFTLGSEGVISLNEVSGYGNELNNYMTFTNKQWSLTLKDYYYWGAGDFYWDYGKNTNHYLEGALKYSDKKDKYYGLVAYTFYQNNAIDRNGVYFEGGYKIKENLEATAGYITDYSATNFRTKAGLTHIGIKATREIKISDSWTSKVKTGLYFNPTPSSIWAGPGISTAPVNFIVSMSF